MKNDLILGATYQHYKGPLYRVHDVVRHSETLEELVLYETLHKNELGTMWVRPKAMFLENVTFDGVTRPRFQWVEDNQ